MFDQVIANHEDDASELSALEYITRYVSGDRSFMAIPVFLPLAFRHSYVCIDTNTVKEPKDLNGKRIGAQLYTMTAAVWIRGVLQHEYGIDLSSIEWVQGKMEVLVRMENRRPCRPWHRQDHAKHQSDEITVGPPP